MLILLAWLTGFLALAGRDRPLRESAIAAFSGVTVFMLLSTEVLSLLGAIRLVPVAASWLAALLLVLIAQRTYVVAGARRLREFRPPSLATVERLIAGVIGAFAAGGLFAALAYPTTNWDSLVYHLPRVLFWYQNGSVAHYPTSDGRQLFSSTIVDYFILNHMVLGGGSDRLQNITQWSSYVFAALVISLIAQRLGAGRRGQLISALVCMSIPIAALQASTTQNDLTVALWCATAVYAAMGVFSQEHAEDAHPSLPLAWGAWAGAAAGLAVQSKATAYLVLPAFFVMALIVSVRRIGARRSGAAVLAAIVCFLVLNGFSYARNASTLDGDIIGFGAPTMDHIFTKARDPLRITTTGLKNASSLLGSDSAALNQAIVGAVTATVEAMGGDIDDPLTNEHGKQVYALPGDWLGHDQAPALSVTLLVLLSLASAFSPRLRTSSLQAGYGIAGLVSLAMVTGLITYNAAINRLLLAPLMLLVPLIGCVYSVGHSRISRVVQLISLPLIVASVLIAGAAIAFNGSTRLIPFPGWAPSTQMSPTTGWWEVPYDRLRYKLNPESEALATALSEAVEVNEISSVGVRKRVDGVPVYPLLRALRDTRLQYIDYVVLPDKLQSTEQPPEAVLEIVNVNEYPEGLSDAARQGETLVAPTRVWEGIVVFYRLSPE